MKALLRVGAPRGRLVRQITLGMVAVLLTTTMLTWQYIQWYTLSVLSERDEKLAFEQSEGARSRIAQVFDSLYSDINLLMYDGDIRAIARERKTSMDYDYYTRLKSLHTRLLSMALDDSCIDSVYVYINDSVLISTDVINSVSPYTGGSVPVLQSDFYRNLCGSVYRTRVTAGYHRTDFHAYRSYESDSEPLITLGCASGNSYQDGRRVIMINVSAQALGTLLESCFGEGSMVCLFNGERELLCATGAAAEAGLPEALELPETMSGRGQFSVTLDEGAGQAAFVQADGFVIVKYIPADDNLKEARTLGLVFLAAFLICGVLSVLLVRSWVRRCLKPIGVICEKMGELEVGRLGVQIDLAPRNELGSVIRHFNRMSGALAEMDENKRRTERSLRLQEMNALRAQLNPHFIFNTLNMFRWMAAAHHAQELEECIVALAEILYPVFREDSETIPLKQEINCLEKYLLILGHRFGSQVELQLEMEKKLGTAPVPRLIIQPIVENCVLHGRREDGRPLTVRVTALAREGVLEVSVADNGQGMDAGRLERLRESIRSGEDSERVDGKHIGLSNVHRRIVLQYGERYGVRVDSREGEGTTVTVSMPLVKEK